MIGIAFGEIKEEGKEGHGRNFVKRIKIWFLNHFF